MSINSIGILGLGAMGCLYAARFTDCAKDVRVIASGERAERIARDGFVLNDRAYHPQVVRPDQDSQALDLIIIGVKQHHLADVLDDLAPFVGEQTQIISLLNGMDSEVTLIERFGEDHVLYCTTVGMTPVRDGNRIRATNMGKLFFGAANNDPLPERVRQVQALFDEAGIVYETPVDMLRELWWKFMANVAVNQTSAVLGMPYGILRETPSAHVLMKGLGGEVIALAKAAGINLTQDDLAEFFRIVDTLDPQGKTSMLQDVEAGRTNEVEIFAGTAVALGEKYGIPTPYNTTFLHILRGYMRQ